ncbi:hypothetical protein KO561_07065 [Radiobacillus kanasensis]|uniref:hypothetical protein n=1 Tax=Radiobacillus kanasensis TaxID=2844358 RepID=UPI001E4C35F0|nr:hypothetical protein [Radiobacillus kanasensis]UFU00689.1 hypothetical protein KO561_07065 [Radiobacillus kanasensis]
MVKKIGIYGWTFIITILIVGISAATVYFMFSTPSSEEKAEVNQEQTKAEDIDEETAEKIKEVQATVGAEHRDLGKFISTVHEFYNDTTGYGAIDHLNWEEQRKMADDILSTLSGFIETASDENLKSDLQDIQRLANAVKEEKGAGHVRNLHRYFHDLDIALNQYSNYRQVWNVTKTLAAE